MSVRVTLVMWLGLSAAVDATAQRDAEQYPTRPVRLIVPFAPGGGTDLMVRIFAQRLEINVENFVKTGREFNAAIQPGPFNPDRNRVAGKGIAGMHAALAAKA